jgi:hypothetical protein
MDVPDFQEQLVDSLVSYFVYYIVLVYCKRILLPSFVVQSGLALAHLAKHAKISYSYTPTSMHLALQQGKNLPKHILLDVFDVT